MHLKMLLLKKIQQKKKTNGGIFRVKGVIDKAFSQVQIILKEKSES